MLKGLDGSLYLYNNMSMRRKKDHISAEPSGEQGLFNRIAVLRTERGLSRRDLAEALGVNYQTIGYLERGEYSPSLELTFRLSELFGLPIEAIFSRTPFRPLSEALYAGSRSHGGEENS
jgi:DNA-binding XRE family transcriptional regulator